jgi:Ion channel
MPLPAGSDAYGAMTQVQRVTVLLPLVLGAGAIVCTIFIHALGVVATIHFVRRELRLGRAGKSFWIDVGIIAITTSFALVAHLIEIALWAVLFVICREFSEFGTAYYHSAVNYTSLGYGDVIMSPSWRLLGPLEAANGALMFGFSTAMIFAVIILLVQKRFGEFGDLR